MAYSDSYGTACKMTLTSLIVRRLSSHIINHYSLAYSLTRSLNQSINQSKKKKKQKNLLFCEFKLLVTKDKICGILLKSIIQ